MNARRVELRGKAGIFADVRRVLRPGDRVVVGRSRFVALSAATTPLARRLGRGALEANPAFRRMSRRHFEVVFEGADAVVVLDRSANGTAADGRRIDGTLRLAFDALARRPVVLRFGAGEELLLVAASDDARA